MDQYSDLAFANAIRLEPQKYIKSLVRGLSRNGSFTEYEDFEKFLLEHQNQLLKIFHVADQISNHGPRDESDDAISIMRKIIESEIFHEIEVFSSGSSPNWQNPKKLIGYLIVHIMVFLDPDIRNRVPGQRYHEFHNLLNGADCPIIKNSFISVNDVKNIIDSLGDTFLRAYFKTHIENYHRETVIYKFANGQELLTISQYIMGSSKKSLEVIYKKALNLIVSGFLAVLPQQSCNDADRDVKSQSRKIPQPARQNHEQQLPIAVPYNLNQNSELDFYIEPGLIYTNLANNQQTQPIIDLLPIIGHKNLISAPPMYGKTRLMYEIIARNPYPNIQHIYIDLPRFVRSGQPSIYRYAARETITTQNLDPRQLEYLYNHLEILDMQGVIVWHLDDWDSVDPSNQSAITAAINTLRSTLISTVDAESTLETISVDQPSGIDGIIHILPFSPGRIWQYFARYSQGGLCSDRSNDKKLHLIARYPGLAKIPPSLKFLMENFDYHQTEIEIIEKFLARLSGTENIENMFSRISRWVLTDHILATASEEVGYPINKTFVVQSLSHLPPSAAEQTVTRWLQNSVKAKILYRVSDEIYNFVIPEVGYWIISRFLCGVDIDTNVSILDKAIRINIENPFTRFFLEYVLWYGI